MDNSTFDTKRQSYSCVVYYRILVYTVRRWVSLTDLKNGQIWSFWKNSGPESNGFLYRLCLLTGVPYHKVQKVMINFRYFVIFSSNKKFAYYTRMLPKLTSILLFLMPLSKCTQNRLSTLSGRDKWVLSFGHFLTAPKSSKLKTNFWWTASIQCTG